MKKKHYLLIIILIIFTLNACEKEKQYEIDDQKIRNYLQENNIDAEKHASGIYYYIEKEGDGVQPNSYSTVLIHYKGYLLDGTEFDSSYDRGEAVTMSLPNTITGWQIGIPLLRKGGKGTLFIPSTLGYGSQSPSALIPENSVLIFDIELLEVAK